MDGWNIGPKCNYCILMGWAAEHFWEWSSKLRINVFTQLCTDMQEKMRVRLMWKHFSEPFAGVFITTPPSPFLTCPHYATNLPIAQHCIEEKFARHGRCLVSDEEEWKEAFRHIIIWIEDYVLSGVNFWSRKCMKSPVVFVAPQRAFPLSQPTFTIENLNLSSKN